MVKDKILMHFILSLKIIATRLILIGIITLIWDLDSFIHQIDEKSFIIIFKNSIHLS